MLQTCIFSDGQQAVTPLFTGAIISLLVHIYILKFLYILLYFKDVQFIRLNHVGMKQSCHVFTWILFYIWLKKYFFQFECNTSVMYETYTIVLHVLNVLHVMCKTRTPHVMWNSCHRVFISVICSWIHHVIILLCDWIFSSCFRSWFWDCWRERSRATLTAFHGSCEKCLIYVWRDINPSTMCPDSSPMQRVGMFTFLKFQNIAIFIFNWLCERWYIKRFNKRSQGKSL